MIKEKIKLFHPHKKRGKKNQKEGNCVEHPYLLYVLRYADLSLGRLHPFL